MDVIDRVPPQVGATGRESVQDAASDPVVCAPRVIVGMMIRESMLRSGKGPQDILGFGEIVKKLLEG